MLRVFQHIVVLLVVSVCCSSQDLRGLAHSPDFNVSIILPGEPSYTSVTQPCTYIHASFWVFSATEVSTSQSAV